MKTSVERLQGEPPSPAGSAPGNRRPNDGLRRRKAGPADGGTAAALRGGPGPPPLRSRLPPLGNRRPGSGTQPSPRRRPGSGREAGAGGSRALVTSARPLGSSASRPLSTRLSLSMPPASARAPAALPHARPDCPSPPQGLPAPACPAPPAATCARQVDEGQRRRRGGCRGM